MNSSEPGRPGSGIALLAAAPEVVAHAPVLAIAVREAVNVFQSDPRHISSHSLRSLMDGASPSFFNTSTIFPSLATSARATLTPAFIAALSARMRSISLKVQGPCPMDATPYGSRLRNSQKSVGRRRLMQSPAPQVDSLCASLGVLRQYPGGGPAPSRMRISSCLVSNARFAHRVRA